MGTAVEIPSYAATSGIVFFGEDSTHRYYPNTGYLIHTWVGYGHGSISKYVLPKGLTLKTIKNLKGTFPGVSINATDKKSGGKNIIWQKRWENIKINRVDGELNPTNVGPNSSAGTDNYINNTKMDIIFAKAKRTWKSSNSIEKNFDLIFK
jgi:hypothetical protein